MYIATIVNTTDDTYVEIVLTDDTEISKLLSIISNRPVFSISSIERRELCLGLDEFVDMITN